MTYIVQASVDFSAAARRGLRDVYDWHQAAWECFPGRDGKARDFLTRLDEKDQGFQLLIVSPVAPTRPDWCPLDSWRGPKEVPAGYFSRSRYRFQLCANPTKKVAVRIPDGSFKKNGRREPLRTREDLLEWIARKGEQGGFAIEQERRLTCRIVDRYGDALRRNARMSFEYRLLHSKPARAPIGSPFGNTE